MSFSLVYRQDVSDRNEIDKAMNRCSNHHPEIPYYCDCVSPRKSSNANSTADC